jgi:histidinol-phosphate aminotransferase
MDINYLALAHPQIQSLVPYQPGGSKEALQKRFDPNDIIKLASNENPLGYSEAVYSTLAKNLDNLNLYPDANAIELKDKLANFHEINIEQITIGNGSENLISLLVQVFSKESSQIILPKYSFIAYKINAKAHNVAFKEIPSPNYTTDIKNLPRHIDEQTSLVFMANPNNPTGNYFNESELIAMLSKIPKTTLVVLDEAYYDYAKSNPGYPDSLKLLKNHPNLVILRTFSKVYGLAGLRIGYSISNPLVADALNRARAPFNLGTLSQKAAVAALSDQSFVNESVLLNNQGLQQYQDAFKQLRIKVLPSAGNFICAEFGSNATTIYNKILDNGIMLRTLAPYSMPNHLRISIGTQEQNERTINQLSNILRKEDV